MDIVKNCSKNIISTDVRDQLYLWILLGIQSIIKCEEDAIQILYKIHLEYDRQSTLGNESHLKFIDIKIDISHVDTTNLMVKETFQKVIKSSINPMVYL